MMEPEEYSDKDGENFYCPITQELMSDPVVAADGHSYERAAIQAWIAQRGGRALSPMTGEKLAHLELTPNITLRTVIRDYQTTLPERHRRTLTEADLLLAIKLREEELSGILAKQGQQLSAVAQAKAKAEEKLGPLGQEVQRVTQQNQQLQAEIARLRSQTLTSREQNSLSDKILTEHLSEIQRLSQEIETVTTSHAANSIKRAFSNHINHKKLKQTSLIRQEEDTLHQLEILQQEGQQTQAGLQQQLDEGIEALDTQLKLKLSEIAKEMAMHVGEEGDDDTVEQLINQRRQIREAHATEQASVHAKHQTEQRVVTEAQRLKTDAEKVRLQQIKGSKASKQRELSRWAGYTARFTNAIEADRAQLAEAMAERALVSERVASYTKRPVGDRIKAVTAVQKPSDLMKYWAMVFNHVENPDEEQQRFLTELKWTLEKSAINNEHLVFLQNLSRSLLTEMENSKDESVCKALAASVVVLGQANHPEFIPALLTAAKDEDWSVCRTAAKTLGKLGHATPDIIQVLLKAVSNEDESVRSSAVKILGKLGQSTPDIIQTLLMALKKDWDSSVLCTAVEALCKLGQPCPDVIQVLLERRAYRESPYVRDEVLRKLGEARADVIQALLERVKDKNQMISSAADEALGSLDHASPDVIQALLKAVRDEDSKVRNAAVNILGKLGSARAVMLESLGYKDWNVRGAVSRGLSELGHASLDIVKVLLKAARDEDTSVRGAALQILGNLEQPTSDIIQALLMALKKDKDSSVRKVALETLERLRQASPDVIQPLLMALKRDRDSSVRNAVLETLERLGQASPDVIQALRMAVTDDKDTSVRCTALKALGKLGHASPDVIQALRMAVTDDKDTSVRRTALAALERLGQASPDVIQALLMALKKDKDSSVRCTALATLDRLGQASPDIIQALLMAVTDDKDAWVRRTALATLERPGQASPDVIQALLMALKKDKDSSVRCTALATLERLGQASPDVIQALLMALNDDKDERVRRTAVEALGKLGQASPDVIQALLMAAKEHKESSVFCDVLESLGKLGQASPDVIQALLMAIKDDKDERGRHTAVEALGKLGQASPDIIQALLTAAKKDENSWVRRAVAETLGKLMQASPETIQALLMVAKEDKDDRVRAVALEAMGQLEKPGREIIEVLLDSIALTEMLEHPSILEESVLSAIHHLLKEDASALHTIRLLLLAMKDEGKNQKIRFVVALLLGDYWIMSLFPAFKSREVFKVDDADVAQFISDVIPAFNDIIKVLLAAIKDGKFPGLAINFLARMQESFQKQLLENAEHLKDLLIQWQEKYVLSGKVSYATNNWFSVLLSSPSNLTLFGSMNAKRPKPPALNEPLENQQAEGAQVIEDRQLKL